MQSSCAYERIRILQAREEYLDETFVLHVAERAGGRASHIARRVIDQHRGERTELSYPGRARRGLSHPNLGILEQRSGRSQREARHMLSDRQSDKPVLIPRRRSQKRPGTRHQTGNGPDRRDPNVGHGVRHQTSTIGARTRASPLPQLGERVKRPGSYSGDVVIQRRS